MVKISSEDRMGAEDPWTGSFIDVLEVFCKGILQEYIPHQKPVDIRLH